MDQGPYVRPGTLTELEIKVGSTFELTDLGKSFMDGISEAQELRPTINGIL